MSYEYSTGRNIAVLVVLTIKLLLIVVYCCNRKPRSRRLHQPIPSPPVCNATTAGYPTTASGYHNAAAGYPTAAAGYPTAVVGYPTTVNVNIPAAAGFDTTEVGFRQDIAPPPSYSEATGCAGAAAGVRHEAGPPVGAGVEPVSTPPHIVIDTGRPAEVVTRHGFTG